MSSGEIILLLTAIVFVAVFLYLKFKKKDVENEKKEQ